MKKVILVLLCIFLLNISFQEKMISLSLHLYIDSSHSNKGPDSSWPCLRSGVQQA